MSLSMICIQPAHDVRKSASFPIKFVMSFLYHPEHGALKSPVTTEQTGSSSFI